MKRVCRLKTRENAKDDRGYEIHFWFSEMLVIMFIFELDKNTDGEYLFHQERYVAVEKEQE